MSVRTATVQAQRVLNATDSTVAIDGVWGRKTDSAYVAAPPAVKRSVERVVQETGYDMQAVRARILTSGGGMNGPAFDELVAKAKAAGITGESLVNFVATCFAESGLRLRAENGSYTLKGARATFGNRLARLTDDQVRALLGDDGERLFNIVYGNRMGNVSPGDGSKYRGRGYIQLTGKANYEAFTKSSGIDVVSNPDLLLTSDVATQSAIWFWKQNVMRLGASGNLKAATQVVRGGVSSTDETNRRSALATEARSVLA